VPISNQERILAQETCAVPADSPTVFSAQLGIHVDPATKTSRAVLRLIGLGKRNVYSGGYSHKPGDVVSIPQLIDRAIVRTLKGFNEPTSLSVVVPSTAEVGETVSLDARSTWDADGDPFELQWRVRVPACVDGAGVPLPVDGQPCPHGTRRALVPTSHSTGEHDQMRKFGADLVGDYEVEVHSKVGNRDEPAQRFNVRVAPRRSNTLFARIHYLPLPRNFLRTTNDHDAGLLISAGLTRRFVHRVGLLGYFEEMHLGLSLSSLQPAKAFDFDTSAIGTFLGVEVAVRTLDRTGRFGLTWPLTLQGGLLIAQRGDYDVNEPALMVQSGISGYFSFGENYRHRRNTMCLSLCPTVSLGPTLGAVYNVGTKNLGVPVGFEVVTGAEF
jgi:hypothetical protein